MLNFQLIMRLHPDIVVLSTAVKKYVQMINIYSL
jgi:hypothetical protein